MISTRKEFLMEKMIIFVLVLGYYHVPLIAAELSPEDATLHGLEEDYWSEHEAIHPNEDPSEVESQSRSSIGTNSSAAERGYHDDYFFTDLGGGNVWDKINSLTAGRYGPQLLEDMLFTEEMNHFNRERIPERVVHARGAGAIGYFEPTNSDVIRKFCKTPLFHAKGRKFPVVARFSTVIQSKGSADTVRDPRGFAVKIKTDEGNWDIVGLDFPVFFVRDSLRFFNFIHSQKPDPITDTINYDSYWDFISLVPETLHAVSHLYTDLGTPDGYRHMNGFSINTFRLINDDGNVVFGRFHFLTNQGVRNLTMAQATKLAGTNPRYSTEDLYQAIKKGKYPSWTLYIQMMTMEQARDWEYNAFDETKKWPTKKFPLIEAGKMVLNRNPKNYFAQVEQLIYNPANIIPGIEPSSDKILQGRLVAYHDAQGHRLGVNNFKIPINRPFKLVTPTLRDGICVFDKKFTNEPTYFPNSFGKAREDESRRPPRNSLKHIPTKVEFDRFNSLNEDNYSQVGQFWESLSPRDQKNLISNMAAHLSNAKKFIQERLLGQLKKVHKDYYESLRAALKKYQKP
ncbi:catalase-like [Brevipalpus obovatus]|uniref:catalase-like n=1 Tax=Brevipalpus obovatus TaxID=246614 RepID=UPI003D9EDED7